MNVGKEMTVSVERGVSGTSLAPIEHGLLLGSGSVYPSQRENNRPSQVLLDSDEIHTLVELTRSGQSDHRPFLLTPVACQSNLKTTAEVNRDRLLEGLTGVIYVFDYAYQLELWRRGLSLHLQLNLIQEETGYIGNEYRVRLARLRGLGGDPRYLDLLPVDKNRAAVTSLKERERDELGYFRRMQLAI